MINYIEKGIGLWTAIRAAGHVMSAVDGVYTSDNDVAVQAIINAYNPLADQKADAVASIAATGLTKMQTLFPALNSVDTVNLMAELWKSLAPAARVPTTNWQTIINIYNAAMTGIAAVNAATMKTGIDAAVTAIVWPV